MSPQARMLSGGRLHLQHGPIDLVIGAEGAARKAALAAAVTRFETILTELVAELPLLRRPLVSDGPRATGAVAQRMSRAVAVRAGRFITPMAAVAGSVADEVLDAMRAAGPLMRAYVNNGGDIALHLASGQRFTTAMQGVDGSDLGRIEILAEQGIGGIATSGRHGRSLSRGIADSVTVLAGCAAAADAAATLIANAVDVPGHPAIRRVAANTLDPDSDLGARAVVTGCGLLSQDDRRTALQNGLAEAERTLRARMIHAASLHLQGDGRVIGTEMTFNHRILEHA